MGVIIIINIQLPFKCYSKPADIKHRNHKLGSTQTSIQPQVSIKYKTTCEHFTLR